MMVSLKMVATITEPIEISYWTPDTRASGLAIPTAGMTCPSIRAFPAQPDNKTQTATAAIRSFFMLPSQNRTNHHIREVDDPIGVVVNGQQLLVIL
jgi:hypothetical protein